MAATTQNSASQMNPVDAQRTIALIEDAIEKLSFLGSLTPDIMAHRDELAAAVGEEITKLIEEQHNLEKRYEDLTRQRAEAEVRPNPLSCLDAETEYGLRPDPLS